MKKSTLLFLIGNILVLLAPIVLMLGMRFKINSGEVIDIRAEEEARTIIKTFADIENIELNSKNDMVTVNINRDSINEIVMDTSDYRYLTYTVKDKTLIIDYNYIKDSLENGRQEERQRGVSVYKYNYNNGGQKSITLYLKPGLKRITIKDGKVLLNLAEGANLKNDLDINVSDGNFGFNTVGSPNNYEEETYIASYDPSRVHEEEARWDSIPYKVNVTLRGGSFDANLRYIKELKIDSRYSFINIYSTDFDQYNLTLDESTDTKVSVAKLKKMKIAYVK